IAGVVQFARPATASGGDALSGLLGSLGAGAAGAAGAAGSAGAAAAAGSGGGDQNVAGVDDVLSVGDRVSAGTPILSIVDISEIGLAGEVDETDVLLVSPGVAADVELDAAPGFSYHATVQSVDLLPTPSARGGVAYRVRLTFQTGPANQPPASGDPPSGNDPPSGEEPPPTPRPGMSAVAHLRVRTATDAMTVPAAAVFSTDQGDAVWLVQDGVAVRRKVEVGVQGADLVAIESGLSPGQRIVISGADKVSAGQAVK
ncbi:MAG TPA: HlyD family efflux transporter periplasmic adaptor subunit, partial [Micromonosporaceae bacterium]